MKGVYLRLQLLTVGVVLIAGTARFYRSSAVKPLLPPAMDTNGLTGRDLADKFHRSLSAPEEMHILDGNFVIITSTEALPEPVKNAFVTITGVKPFALADRDQKYQEADVIDERGLANRRLILAGVCKNRWFIHYEHGGIGVSDAILVLDVAPNNSMRFVWGGAGFKKATTVDDLRTAIANGTFTDNHAFYW
jgi:hypothetical protein